MSGLHPTNPRRSALSDKRRSGSREPVGLTTAAQGSAATLRMNDARMKGRRVVPAQKPPARVVLDNPPRATL
jgi:hypothetical protein